MALIQLGGGVTDIRGKMGGNVFSRCAGGNYVRRGVKPVNPRTIRQTNRRSAFADLTEQWSGVLTQQMRDDWSAYAANTSWTNKLGQNISINGLAAYVRLNSLLLLWGGPVHNQAPTAYGHAAGIVTTHTATTSTQIIAVADPSEGWDKDTDLDKWMIFQYAPNPVGRLALPKIVRYQGGIEGSVAAPPALPMDLPALWTFFEGQRISMGHVHIDPNYRVSVRTYSQIVAIP